MRRGAGTDANVSMILFGEKGQTPSTKLSNNKNNFERGQVSVIRNFEGHLQDPRALMPVSINLLPLSVFLGT